MSASPVVSKAALDEAQRMLAFSQHGYALLDRKRHVLMQQLLEAIAKAEELFQAYAEASARLHQALDASLKSKTMLELSRLAEGVHPRGVKRLERSVMGVALPQFFDVDEESPLRPSVGLFRSDEGFDRALKEAQAYRQALFRVLEQDAAMEKLLQAMRVTSRRADGLKRLQIPRYEAEVKRLALALEEKEREDLFRIKVMKKKRVEA